MNSDMARVVTRREALIAGVKQVLISSLDLESTPSEIAEDSALFGFGLGLDSIDALTLIVAIEDSFGVRIPDENLWVLQSANTIADFILKQGGENAAG